jgi:chemotaxis protein MotB
MRARRSRDGAGGSGVSEWMTTYSDLVTLLLCFFVLLFSFSVIDAKKFEAIIRSFQGSLGVLDSGKTIDEDQYISQALQSSRLMREQEEAESMEWLYRQLDEYIQQRKGDCSSGSRTRYCSTRARRSLGRTGSP